MTDKSAKRLTFFGCMMVLLVVLIMITLAWFMVPTFVWDGILVFEGIGLGLIIAPYISVLLDHFAEKHNNSK